MENDEMSIDLYDLFRKLLQVILRTWKFMALVLLAAAIGTAAYIHHTFTPLYESKTTFAVSKELNGEENYLYNKEAADELSASFEAILYSDVMQDALRAELGTTVLPAQIISSRVGTTNLFTVAARSENPGAAEQVIQAFLDNYARVFRASMMEIGLEVVESPEAAAVCNSPQYLKKEVYICGGLFLVYLMCAGCYALFRRTVTEEEDVREYLRTDCLGTLPYTRAVEKKQELPPLITRDGSRYYEMKEAAGGIRRRMEQEKERSGSSTYLVTGAAEREGVSTAAANLALSLAYRGWKTALADLDLRKPSQLARLPAEKGGDRKRVMKIGDTEIRAEKTDLTDNLAVYGAMRPAEKAAEILSGKKMQYFLKGLKERYDFLIIDSPPLLSFADAQTLAKTVDTSIFVVREDRLPAGSLADAMEMLNESSPHIFGCIINGSRTHVSRYGYGYGYGYGYRYGYGYGGYRRRYGYGYADRSRKKRETKKRPRKINIEK